MRIVQDMIALKGHIKTIAIYPENGLRPYLRGMDNSAYIPGTKDFHETEIYQKLMESSNGIVWMQIPKGTSELYQSSRTDKVVLCRKIVRPGAKKTLGFVVIGVGQDYFDNLCKNVVKNESESILVIDAGGSVLSQIGKIDPKLKKTLTGPSFVHQDFEKRDTHFSYGNYEVVCTQTSAEASIICKVVKRYDLQMRLWDIAYMPLVILAFFMLGLLPLLLIISNIVTKPLRKLNEAINDVSEGNFDQQVEVLTHDEALYERIPLNMLYLAVCLVLIALALFKAVTRYLDREVVQKIGEVNGKLHKITMGDLNVKIDVQSSREFFELSRYINEMLQSLLVNDRKMTYVLGKTDMHIGVYEYNRQMKRVRFTGDILQILKTGTEAAWKLPSDWEDFKKYIRTMQKEPVAGENEIFAVGNGKYLKIEEIQEGEEIFGVITDVTEEIRKRREIEYQRDHDQLTGLFNRTGRDTRLSKILEECREPYYCAAVMVDADGLKMVNDTYGHENGDEYLKRIAEMLKQEAGENSILCRQGGDEFTLFYYKYGKEALVQKIEALKALQSGQKVRLRDGLTVDLRFSMGSSMAYGAVDYDKMYREADEKMYDDKRMRKKLAEETNTIES